MYHNVSRENGKPDYVIIYELFHKLKPGTKLRHDEIINALQEGTVRTITMDNVYAAVSRANDVLLEKHQYCLVPIRGEGYRIIHANEHVKVALNKKKTAANYIKKGMKILKETRLNELSDKERAYHIEQSILLQQNYQTITFYEEDKAARDSIINQVLDRQRTVKKQKDNGMTINVYNQ